MKSALKVVYEQKKLITPARNEAAFIEMTIQSVIAQTVLPKLWVIVSDGSTDGTDEIVAKYLLGRDWLELVRLPERRERNFAAKVHAFNAGLERVRDLSYEVSGNVDADISFGEDFFAFLLQKFEEMPDLGVAGTHYVEGDFHSFRDSYINVHHVNGQCQLFRRTCFEDIGGYVPIKGGGIDWVAVTTARMKGWTTLSFAERTFYHHRAMGTEGGSVLKARFHYGRKDYFLGGHPLWQLFRGAFQMAKRPYVVGGLLLVSGYFWAWISGHERSVSLFAGIVKLPAAHTLTWQDGKTEIRRYWSLDGGEEPDRGEEHYRGELLELLSESVRGQLVGDVPLGATHTGGHDSSTIVALMSRVADRPVKTFTIGLGGAKDELKDARIVADRFKTDHTEFIVDPSRFTEMLPRILWHLEEPVPSSILPTWYLGEAARKIVTVILIGEGSDEIFAGYRRFWPVAEKYRRLTPAALKRWFYFWHIEAQLGQQGAQLFSRIGALLSLQCANQCARPSAPPARRGAAFEVEAIEGWVQSFRATRL